MAPLWLNLNWISEIGLNLFVFGGDPLPHYESQEIPTSPRWGIHSKRAVIDGKTSIVGTYNIDPRSANLNSELMVVCKDNQELASEIAHSIQTRMKQSELLLSEGKIKNASALLSKATWMQKFMTIISLPIASTFDFIL